MSSQSVFQAVFTLLNTSAALKTKVKGVYDFVPEGTVGPYIKIQFSQGLRGRVLNEKERVMYFNLHIWSSYNGSKEVLEIIDLVSGIIPKSGSLKKVSRFSEMRAVGTMGLSH